MARSAGLVGLATSASRVLGLVREQTVAFLFGAGMETDAFNVAFRIPNLLRDLFAEGALSSAFVPTFTSTLTRNGRQQAFALAGKVVGALLLVVGALCLLGFLFTPALVRCFAPGIWSVPGKGELTVDLTRIMLPFLLLIALAALAMGMLNSLGRYVLPALAPVMLNLGMIVVGTGLALAAPRLGMTPVAGLAIGVMVGGFGQLVVQLPPLWREGFAARPRVDFGDAGVRQILGLMAPAAIGLAATQVNILVNTQIASFLVEGSISWLNYAFRLMQLPIGVFGVSVATVMLPAVARHLALREMESARARVAGALLLMNPMGHRGLALATAVTGLLNFVILVRPAARRLDGLELPALLSCILRVTIACTAMGLAMHWAVGLVPGTLTGVVPVDRALPLALAGLFGAPVLVGAAKVLGIAEIDEIVTMVGRKLGRAR
ncbi:MAG: murein biosynthesis integral membrane protein MurJ [Candidatus Riflebacteria bacterium]|nr:murein biosynthesis integral membrane protein MurJ [Candidatus Riflebacteria bacterium]